MAQDYEVRQESWCGEPVIALADARAGLTARLAPRLGGNLFSLWSEPDQHEILFSPATPEQLIDRPTRFGVPILMPPGRLRHGTFTYGDHTYQFDRNRGENHAHGLVLTRPWEVEEAEAGPDGARVVISIRSWRFFDLLRQFPHGFHLRVEYRVTDGMLLCRSTIENQSDRPMPFGMGFHTYFNAPGDPMSWSLRLDAAERWELEADYPTGRLLPVAGAYDLREGRPLGVAPLDDVFSHLGRDAEGWSRVELASAQTGLRVLCEADGHFPHWVLFSGSDAGRTFLAPEPYTLVSNGLNLPVPPEQTGLREIAPGARENVGTWRVRLER